jgi:hypothetical protein
MESMPLYLPVISTYVAHRRVVERHSIDTEAGKLAELFRLTCARS